MKQKRRGARLSRLALTALVLGLALVAPPVQHATAMPARPVSRPGVRPHATPLMPANGTSLVPRAAAGFTGAGAAIGSPAPHTERAASAGAVSVVTQHNDNARTGANLQETLLNTANVNASQFGKVFTRTVDGEIYAQPLYVPNLSLPKQGTHNVVIVATMHDSVYAFDADNPDASAPLWRVSLGRSVKVPDPCFGYRYGSYHDIRREVGIVSTPVIDLNTNTLYVVATTREGPSLNCPPTAYAHRLHALDLTTGLEKFGGPVVITASVPGSGPDAVNGFISLTSMRQLQRPGLLLSGGVVYLAFGSYADTDTYHGWVLGYNAQTLQQVSVFLDTPDVGANNYKGHPYEGGIWQSGQGPAADSSGNLYLGIGNGDWNADQGGHDYGNSIVKLTSTLSATDWFTPYNVKVLNYSDLDLGSSGALLLPGTTLLLQGGKQGVLYLLDTNKLGHFHSGSDSQIVQSFPATAGVIHGGPVYWDGPTGRLIYVWGDNDYLKSYLFSGSLFQTTPAFTGTQLLPPGDNGAVSSLSANGSTAGSGILWSAHAMSGSASFRAVPGVLEAYDAANVGHLLWSSQQNAARDAVGAYAKFAAPTIANGKVYLGTFSGTLDVYGLLQSGAASGASPHATSAWHAATSARQAAAGAQPSRECCAGSLAWSRRGDRLALAAGTRVRVLQGPGRTLMTLAAGASAVTAVAWSPDGATLAAGSRDGTIRLWDRAGRPLPALSGQAGAVTALGWSPNGLFLAGASTDGTVRVWQQDHARLTNLVGDDAPLSALAWSPDSHMLAFGGAGAVWVQYLDGRPRAVLRPAGGLSAIGWSADGTLLATGGRSGLVCLWSTGGKPIALARGHSAAVTALAWSPQRPLLATGSLDGSVRLWTRLGHPVGVLLRTAGGVRSLAWAPDGRRLAVLGVDGALHLVSPRLPAQQPARPAAHNGQLATGDDNLAFSTG